jgi:hypothetical protein
MNQLRRTRACAAREVAFLYERNLETSRCGVERDPCASDATANHRKIEDLAPHTIEVFGPTTEG